MFFFINSTHFSLHFLLLILHDEIIPLICYSTNGLCYFLVRFTKTDTNLYLIGEFITSDT